MNEESSWRALSQSDASRIVERLTANLAKLKGEEVFFDDGSAEYKQQIDSLTAEVSEVFGQFVSAAQRVQATLSGEVATDEVSRDTEAQLDWCWGQILGRRRTIAALKEEMEIVVNEASNAKHQLRVNSGRLRRIEAIRNQLPEERPPSSIVFPPDLQREVDRLKALFDRLGLKFDTASASTSLEVQWTEDDTGIVFDDHLKTFWLSFGGSGDCSWFTTDIEYYGFRWLDLHEALTVWLDDQDDSTDADDDEREAAIQPEYCRHPRWFPIAESMGEDLLMFDAAPTAMGTFGQIIEYHCEPESVRLVANSFLEMFQRSNDILEELLQRHSDYLSEIFPMLID